MIMKENEIIITREAQGRSREAGSEGSVNQTGEPMNKNGIGGIGSGRAGQGLQSPSGKPDDVNAVVVPGKCMDLPGEISTNGRTGFQSTHPTFRAEGSDARGIDRGEVSRRQINRGNERGVAEEPNR